MPERVREEPRGFDGEQDFRPRSRLRIAVIGSPRSGNTWLRGLLALLYGLDELAVARPEDVPWDALPERCALQIHWLREEPLVSLLAQHGFRVISPARHPLDVLISSLNYQQYIPNPSRWMDIEGRERTLLGATPRSPHFLDYACMNHRGSLLSITPDWWSGPDVLRVRYEDLIADGVATLGRLAEALDPRVALPIDVVLTARTLERERVQPGVWHYHYWQGRPGLWRGLLPSREARKLAHFHREVFEALGYACDPDEGLSDDRADAYWHELQHTTMRRHLDEERSRHEKTKIALADALAQASRRGEQPASQPKTDEPRQQPEVCGSTESLGGPCRDGTEPDRPAERCPGDLAA